MPPTSDHEQFFHGFEATGSNDRRAYTPNKGRHTNTLDRTGKNHHMDKSAQAEAYLDRYAVRGASTRFQDRQSKEGYDGYGSSADGSHHNSSDLSSSSSPERSISPECHSRNPSPPHDRNLGSGSSHLKSHTPQQYEWSSRSTHAPPHCTSVTTPSCDGYFYGSRDYHVSPHDRTSPAGGHRHGSHSHRTESSAAYLGGQGQGSCGHSSGSTCSSSRDPSGRNLSRTANTSTHQTPLRSPSKVSARKLKTLLRLNVLPCDYSNAVDSGDFSSHYSNLINVGSRSAKDHAPRDILDSPTHGPASHPPLTNEDASYEPAG
jgi:hypothetical protein